MAKKSKLLAALDAHRGRNYLLERQKKQQKQAEKRKSSHVQEQRSDRSETKAAKLNGFEEVRDTESHLRQSGESEDVVVRVMNVRNNILLLHF